MSERWAGVGGKTFTEIKPDPTLTPVSGTNGTSRSKIS